MISNEEANREVVERVKKEAAFMAKLGEPIKILRRGHFWLGIWKGDTGVFTYRKHLDGPWDYYSRTEYSWEFIQDLLEVWRS